MPSCTDSARRHTEAVKTFQGNRRALTFSAAAAAAALVLAACAGGPGTGPPTVGVPSTGSSTAAAGSTEASQAAGTGTAGSGTAGSGAGPESTPAMNPTTGGGQDYSDAQLQSLLQGVKLQGAGELRVDDPRAVASGARGDYQDISDPKRGIRPGQCELFESYLMFNAANGTLASGLLVPSTPEDQNAMKMTGTYRSVSAVHPASAGGPSEFRQRLEAYSACGTVREVSLLGAKPQMDIARLPGQVSAAQSFAVSQLTSGPVRVGAIYVGGTKAGVDVIYRQSVNGNAADTLDFDAAARQGADVVNQVLGRLP